MNTEGNLAQYNDLEKIIRIGLRYWKSIIVIVAVILVITAVVVYQMPFEYKAQATIFPSMMLRGQEGSFQPGMFAGVSRQLGINFGGGASDQSILFESILKSRQFLIRIIEAEFESIDGDPVFLKEYLVHEDTPESLKLQQAFESFKLNCLRVNYTPETGMTKISVIFGDPVLAASVANKIVEEIETYTHEMLAAGSDDWAGFIEARLEEVSTNLDVSELNLEKFRNKNRVLDNSPELMLQMGRLKRDVELQQQLFITLKQQYEIARIEAQKDLAKIAILDEAVPPAYRFRPLRSVYMMFALFAGALVGLIQALVRFRFFSEQSKALH